MGSPRREMTLVRAVYCPEFRCPQIADPAVPHHSWGAPPRVIPQGREPIWTFAASQRGPSTPKKDPPRSRTGLPGKIEGNESCGV